MNKYLIKNQHHRGHLQYCKLHFYDDFNDQRVILI